MSPVARGAKEKHVASYVKGTPITWVGAPPAVWVKSGVCFGYASDAHPATARGRDGSDPILCAPVYSPAALWARLGRSGLGSA